MAEDLAAAKRAAQSKAPEGFTVLVESPFIVVGDGPEAEVVRRAEGTVRWAVTMLKKDFFSRNPKNIITIWLFQDDESYGKHAVELFGEAPSTPYGYYSEAHAALVMNISTGGGTLVHEIVHPFMDANFPECPTWFNEGMGSLFEQSSQVDGHIVGMPNWRLAGLAEAISRAEVPSFETLMSTTTHQFYDEDPGTNYAQARYLCLYLQAKGLLVAYYREFVKNHATDPTGLETLKRVLDIDDMARFKNEWESWVMSLEFP